MTTRGLLSRGATDRPRTSPRLPRVPLVPLVVSGFTSHLGHMGLQRRIMLYTFADAGPYSYACHEPGHFDAGMRGTIPVVGL